MPSPGRALYYVGARPANQPPGDIYGTLSASATAAVRVNRIAVAGGGCGDWPGHHRCLAPPAVSPPHVAMRFPALLQAGEEPGVDAVAHEIGMDAKVHGAGADIAEVALERE